MVIVRVHGLYGTDHLTTHGALPSGLVRLDISKSFSVAIDVRGGDTAHVLYSTERLAATQPFLVIEGSREVLLSVLEGNVTVCKSWRRPNTLPASCLPASPRADVEPLGPCACI